MGPEMTFPVRPASFAVRLHATTPCSNVIGRSVSRDEPESQCWSCSRLSQHIVNSIRARSITVNSDGSVLGSDRTGPVEEGSVLPGDVPEPHGS